MDPKENKGGTYSYSIAGTNTPTQVTANPTTLYHIVVSHNGGSAGFLQIYNNGTNQVQGPGGTEIGTPAFAIPVNSGTSGAGTPGLREITYGPFGRQMDAGLSYLWSAGPTGTVVHGVNCTVDITLARIL